MLITKDTRVIYRNELGGEVEFSPFSPYFPETVEEDVKNTIHTLKTSRMHGNSYVASSLESRFITINGFLERNEQGVLLKDKLIKTINPTLKGTLRYSNEGKEMEIACIPESIPAVSLNGGVLRFDISLQACTPFWQKKEKVEHLALLTPRLTFPVVIPQGRGMIFGLKKSLLENEVENIGDVESGFRVIFKAKGSAKNPKIYNKLKGDFIKVNYAMAKGDIVEVLNYPEEKKVTINGVKNGFRYLDTETTFFPMRIGKNVIGYGAEENTINLDVILYYTPRFLGV